MPSHPPDTFRKALALHQRGELAGAQALYQQVLDLDPGHFDSLHLLGLALVQSGFLERGTDLIGRAIAVRADFPEAHYNLGHALLSLGRPDEALANFDKAIELKPDDPLYHFERGNALKELSRVADARQSFEQAIRLAPRYAEAYNNIGVVLKDLEKFEEAIGQYDRAIALRPGYAEAHSNRGNALKELNRLEEALASYDCAIRLKPDHAESYSNRGNALAKLRLPEEALASHDVAIRLKPDYAEGYNNRGNVLKDLNRLDDAIVSYDRAISLKPDYAEAYSNRASVLEELGRHEDAVASHDRAISLKPGYAESYCSRGYTLVDLERIDEALADYEKALSLKPSLALARYNKSLLYLRRHAFTEGFELYLSRWEVEKPGTRRPETSIPHWDGSALEGELLLWAEQGLGNEAFFASMLSLLEPRNMKIALSADKRLHPVLARSFPEVRLLSREVTEKSVTGSFAAQAAVGDLGHLLGVDREKIASRRHSYLLANAERQQQLRAASPCLGANLVCGLSWRSGNKKIGQHRSVELSDLAPLLLVPGVTFVNLQYGQVDDEINVAANRLGTRVNIAQDLDVFSDIEGLLALISMCDVVFTIDNVTAHLAGALGKQAVVLVPLGSGRHWYWGGESQSLWYPSLQVVYQDSIGDWTSAIRRGVELQAKLLMR